MSKFFNKKVNAVLSVMLVMLALLLTLQTVITNGVGKATESAVEVAAIGANVNPVHTASEAVTEPTTEPEQTTAEPTTEATEETTVPQETTQPPATEEPTVAYATAVPAKKHASKQAQWDAGYLIAIDNPDTSYKCAQVTLSDYDRDLLERLCMGEFGTGGFIGASLIAQAVKNAICFDGFTSVQAVIDECHYTGRTDIPANEDCKKAVRYIFDENHDAVQHRLLYMYNPGLVNSNFHESQNYILTYQGVRFFDRWGY